MSREDRDLWSRYARTAEPLHPEGRSVTPDIAPPPMSRAAPVLPAPPPIAPFEIGRHARPRDSVHSLAPSISAQVAAATLAMDAKAHRRMKAGKLRPEGTLDLHGMTLDVAHPALIRFVLSAQGAGKRLIVVVTGKGKAKPSEGPIPHRFGVLRHQVPRWLRMPPLGGAVLQVSEAHRSHGGSGAYYVYLRRG